MSTESGGSTVLKGCIVLAFLAALLVIVGAAGLWLLGERSDDGAGHGGTPVALPGGARTDGAAPDAAQGGSATGGDGPASPVVAGAAVARIRARGSLRVAMDTGEPELAGTPPMFFVDAQGGRDGFDYALARLVARELGVGEVELVHGKYSALEDALRSAQGDVDLLISGYTPTDAPGIAWSQPYLEYGLCLVVPAASPVKTTADLFGKKVGIFDDDSAAEEVQRLVKGYTELVRMEDGYWQALLDGRFDGFLYDYPYAAAELQQLQAVQPALRGAFRIAQYNLTDSTYAVGVRAGEGDLLAAVDAAIAQWRASDDYAAAIRRYLKGGEAAALTSASARKVVVKAGDSLSAIAQRELGSSDRWKELWALNRARFPNPHLIEVGDEVELPAS
ncbi:transporter substrate-binding domain-containing protein [Myxococcota bacterium]|nr:transporter substrate-binding domain-containing protein [Myxococcota bacterium]